MVSVLLELTVQQERMLKEHQQSLVIAMTDAHEWIWGLTIGEPNLVHGGQASS